jgi:hypothetical protein
MGGNDHIRSKLQSLSFNDYEFQSAKGNSPLLRIFDSTLVIVSNLHVYNLPWLK